MKWKLILIGFLPFFIMCQSPANLVTQKEKSNIKVFFEVDKKGVIDISDRFSVVFIFNNKSYFGIVEGNDLTLPDFPNDLEYVSVAFKYNGFEIKFPKVGMDLILYEEKIKWEFVVSYPPFNETRIEEVNGKEPSAIYYFRFTPYEGSGIEIIEPNYN